MSTCPDIFDHRNASFAKWFIDEYMISNQTLLHPSGSVSLGFLDDAMTLNGPTEEDSNFVSDTGLSGAEMAEHVAAFTKNMNALYAKLVPMGGWSYQLMQQYSGPHVLARLNKTTEECVAALEEWCSPLPNSTAQTAAHFYGVGEADALQNGEDYTAEFLISRGPFAWIGCKTDAFLSALVCRVANRRASPSDGCCNAAFTYSLCGKYDAPGALRPRPHWWDLDYGKPLGVCKAGVKTEEAKVFTREFEKATVKWDCNAKKGSIVMKTDDGPASPPAALVRRASPCAARATEPAVLHVDDFIHASSPAQRGVQAAVDAAIRSAETRPTALLFTQHEYRLASGNITAHTPVIQVLNATGHPLRIDGCGASIVVTTVEAGLFSIQNVSRIRVGNFTVDYDPLPMTQGTVTAVQSPTQYTLQLEKGFPSLMLPHFLSTINGGWGVGGAAWAIVKDKARPTAHKVGTLNLIRVAGWKDRGGGLFDITLQLCDNCTQCSGCNLHPAQYADVSPKVGDPVVHLARFDAYPSFGLGLCDDCEFSDITIHASPAGTWVGVGVSGLVVRRVSVVPKPGRWHTTSADGVFILDSRVGPVVEDSRFLAIGDDAYVVKTFSGSCFKQSGATYTLGSRTHWSWNSVPRAGDVVRVWNPLSADGLPAGSGVVVSASAPSAGVIVVTLAAPLPGVTCGPESGLQWVNDALTGPGFVFRNNTIQSRRFGCLIMGRDGTIDGNRFVDNPGPSVLLLNDDDYDNPAESRMGFMPRNITIAHNSFQRCSRCVPDPYHAGTGETLLSVISTAVVGPHKGLPEPFQRVGYRGVTNVVLRDNRIDTWFRGPAISIGDAAGATVEHNTISHPPSTKVAAIAVSDANSVAVEANTLAGDWASVGAAIRVEANSTENVTVAHNRLSHRLKSDDLPSQDEPRW